MAAVNQYAVERFCCTSGNCKTCKAGFRLSRRARLLQMLTNNEQIARKCCESFKPYGATIHIEPCN